MIRVFFDERYYPLLRIYSPYRAANDFADYVLEVAQRTYCGGEFVQYTQLVDRTFETLVFFPKTADILHAALAL